MTIAGWLREGANIVGHVPPIPSPEARDAAAAVGRPREAIPPHLNDCNGCVMAAPLFARSDGQAVDPSGR